MKKFINQKLTLILLFLVMVKCLSVNAAELDSLLSVYKSNDFRKLETSEKILIINKIFVKYLDLAPEEAIQFADESLKLNTELNDEKGIALANQNLGNCYFYIGKYDKALNFYLKALKMQEKLGDKSAISGLLNNVATIHGITANYDLSLKYNLMALKINKEINNPYGLARTYNNIGLIYENTQQLDSSLFYYNKSLLIKTQMGNNQNIAITLNNIGLIYKKQEKYKEALENFKKALTLREKENDNYGIASTLTNISDIYMLQGNYSKALENLELSKQIGEKLNLKKILKNTYLSFSELYDKMGNYKESLNYYKLFFAINDSLFNSEKSKLITEIQVKYETDKKENENEIYKLQIQRNKLQNTLLYLGIILFFIIIIVFYYRFKIVSKINKKLHKEVTERKKIEAELELRVKERTKTLEKEIKERTKAEEDLILALEKATESDRLKSAFLTNMSHEIRTPMNGILGFTNLLKERGLSGETQQEYISIIEKSGDRMLNTIKNIMDISMIESNQIKTSISPVDINEQTNTLFSFFKPEIDRKNLDFKLNNTLSDDRATINTDKDKLNSVLTNLIKNAIKYSHKGKIEFGYELTKIKGFDFIEFYVKDNGIGIPKNRLNAIFDRFVQADIEDRDVYEGNGLGLSISKAYIEMLGGEIWVESEVKLGTTFYFTIPYNADKIELKESKDAKSEAKTEYHGKRLKVLIAEDEPFADRHLSILLKNIGKEILHAKTGIEAIEIFQNNPDIDLILMDVKMPILNGHEATKQIRKLNREVIIIAQTAYALEGDKEKAIEAGCDDYISKPIDKDELFEKIENLLRS